MSPVFLVGFGWDEHVSTHAALTARRYHGGVRKGQDLFSVSLLPDIYLPRRLNWGCFCTIIPFVSGELSCSRCEITFSAIWINQVNGFGRFRDALTSGWGRGGGWRLVCFLIPPSCREICGTFVIIDWHRIEVVAFRVFSSRPLRQECLMKFLIISRGGALRACKN
jgi:hypothetical protein